MKSPRLLILALALLSAGLGTIVIRDRVSWERRLTLNRPGVIEVRSDNGIRVDVMRTEHEIVTNVRFNDENQGIQINADGKRVTWVLITTEGFNETVLLDLDGDGMPERRVRKNRRAGTEVRERLASAQWELWSPR